MTDRTLVRLKVLYLCSLTQKVEFNSILNNYCKVPDGPPLAGTGALLLGPSVPSPALPDSG